MKKITKPFILLLFISLLLFSCGQSGNNVSQSQNQLDKSNEPEICGIKGEEIVLRTGPGLNFDKVINQKATEALGETQYANVDYSVKVIVEEIKNDWSKIKVVEPEHLSASHIGWVPSKYIISEKNNHKDLGKLDSSKYEILKTKHNSTVQNFYVLIKFTEFDKDKIREFISQFRNEFCKSSSNVEVYDSKSIISLIGKYPLDKNEYLKVADHFVASSSFDSPESIWWYPFQDIQYKKYGGKNWKKEPIK